MTPDHTSEEWEEIGRRLGEAMAEFTARELECRLMKDEPMRAVAREKCREEIERAAQAGLEDSFSRLLLAKSIPESAERLVALNDVVAALAWEFENCRPKSLEDYWSRAVVETETYYELGRLHQAAGHTGPARTCFDRALSHIENLRGLRPHLKANNPHYEDQAEGKIALASMNLNQCPEK